MTNEPHSPRHGLGSTLRRLPSLDPLQALDYLLGAYDLFDRLREKFSYHGMYEILDYASTLTLADPHGKRAVLIRRERIRFLQNNVVAIHDHAWGDGDLFASYKCQPGVPVDVYEDGSKYNILISLRETKDKGDIVDLWIERVIEGGFTGREEWFETEIDHWTRETTLGIIFPNKRHCRRATLSRRSTEKTIPLPQERFALLPHGRQKLTWSTRRPKLHDRYTIKWTW